MIILDVGSITKQVYVSGNLTAITKVQWDLCDVTLRDRLIATLGVEETHYQSGGRRVGRRLRIECARLCLDLDDVIEESLRLGGCRVRFHLRRVMEQTRNLATPISSWMCDR